MRKTILTPGKLYARLGAEFRRLRPATCQSCAMPMLYALDAAHGDAAHGDDANWAVHHVERLCDDCKPIIADIVRRYALEFDMYDPVFTTRPAKTFFGATSTMPPFQAGS
jgi:hypothetical protein